MEDKNNRPKENLYDLLGVKKGSKPKTIKKAYYKKAKQFHPDKNAQSCKNVRDGMSDKMKEISKAYSVLSDPKQRKFYDETGGVERKISFDAESQAILNTILSQAIEDKNIKSNNLVKEVRKAIEKNKENFLSKLNEIGVNKENLEDILEEKCGGDTNPVKIQFANIINQRLDVMKNQSEQLRHQIKCLDGANDMLEEIMDSGDEMVVQPYFMQRTSPTFNFTGV